MLERSRPAGCPPLLKHCSGLESVLPAASHFLVSCGVQSRIQARFALCDLKAVGWYNLENSFWNCFTEFGDDIRTKCEGAAHAGVESESNGITLSVSDDGYAIDKASLMGPCQPLLLECVILLEWT